MKIVKTSKRVSPPHPDVTRLINTLTETPNDDLAAFIATIPEWKWPRSDLGNWIKVLNKFDAILKDVIRDYDVDKLQIKPFSPQTKSTVLEILRFKRMLLENSTGRKLYASYDRLNSLLFSSDLDVVVADLKVILRPSQQYSSQPPSAQTNNISSARLTSLAQSWTVLRDQSIDLHDFLDAKKAPLEVDLSGDAGDVHFQFYRKSAGDKVQDPASTQPTLPATSESSTAQATPPVQPTAGVSPTTPAKPAVTPVGMTTVHLTGVSSSEKDPIAILAEAVEKHDIPDDEKFDLLCRIRVAKAVAKGHEEEREKLVTARLLAIAIYAHTHGENQAMNTLFLYDPELVTHIAELIQPDREIPSSVQSAALTALDALGRYRAKISEVLTAVNAGVSHGILLSFMRKTVTQLQDASSTSSTDVAEALLSLLMLLTSSPGGGPMIVGAGLIPLIIQTLDIKHPSRLMVVSRTSVLLDNVLYGYANAFPMFCNNSGVDVLVARIAHEVDLNIKECDGEDDDSASTSAYGRLSYSRASVLKHLLRSMHRMMQASGTSEGLRTLIDSSLPNSVKNIMAHRIIFGPAIFSIAINLMSIFVHTEPTSLAILQEAHIPETFYDAIESGIDPALEVISALPNAIGALCLNAAGEAQLAERTRIIPAIFETFTSEKHIKVLGEKENAIVIGTAMDELIRHHPSLKTQVFEAIDAMLVRIEALGRTWKPPKDEEASYILRSSRPVSSSAPEVPDTMEVEQTVPPAATTPDEAPVDEDGKEDMISKLENNPVLAFIDVAAKLLEGLFQYALHCREFITTHNGIERLADLLKVPALPIRFSETPAADSLIQIFRTMAELNPKETLTKLSEITRSTLDESKEFWETMSVDSKFAKFSDLTAEADIEALNKSFRSLVTLQVTIGALGDVYQTVGFSHSRSATTILQILSGTEAPLIVDDLGKIHRVFLWENILLKNAELQARQAEKSTQTSEASRPEASTSISEQSTMVVVDLPKPQDSAERSAFVADESSADGNARTLAYVIAQIPFSLTPFFQAISKLFMSSRRTTDSSLKTLASKLAKQVAGVLLEHCRWDGSTDLKSYFAYGTLVVSFITILLRDERTPQNSLHTLLLIMLKRLQGVDAIIAFGEKSADLVETVLAIPKGDRTPENDTTLAYAYGLMNVTVHLLGIIVSARPLLESSQTVPLITRDKDTRHPEYFEPHDFVVRMRLTCMPFVRRLWESTWLPSAPLPAIKSILNVVVEIMAADHEDSKPEASAEPALPSIQALHAQLRQSNAPDEASITQLVDMGFPRASVERALARTRNNINAAADLLITHPHLFPMNIVNPVPPPPPAAENNPPAEPAPAAEAAAEAAEVPPVDVAPIVVDGEIAEHPEHDDAMSEDEELDTGGSDVPEPAEPEPADTTVALEPARDWKGELNEAREGIRGTVLPKAFVLVDSQPALVFEVKAAFVRLGKLENEGELASILVVQEGASDAILAARCRLLALILNDQSFPITKIPKSEASKVMAIIIETLRRLPEDGSLSATNLPNWLASHLLAAEALLMIGDGINEVTVPTPEGPVPTVELFSEDRFTTEREFVFNVCLRLLKVNELPRDEMLATLRLLVLLTREYEMSTAFANQSGISLLLDHFKTSSKDALAYRAPAFVILRHVIEDALTVESLMKHHLKRFFALSRNRLQEIASMVRNTNPLALRNPKAYLDVCRSICQLMSLRQSSTTYSISLRPNTETTAGGTKTTSEATDAMQVDDAHKASAMASSTLAESLVHYIMTELLRVSKTSATFTSGSSTKDKPVSESPIDPANPTSSASSAPGNQTTTAESSSDYLYTCILMQALTELLASYDSCKAAFVSFHKKRGSTAKEATPKHRPNFLSFLLNEILAAHPTLPGDDHQKKPPLSGWATSIVIALCTDVFGLTNVKEASDELTGARKYVLDALAKAMKDASTNESPDARYGKLFGLAELCYRLLSTRTQTPNGPKDETSIHVAKIMLEKNFVATLTSALTDVDLNYPGMKSLVGAVMRPLEHLTKVAIKMGRASGKTKEGVIDAMETESQTSEEESDLGGSGRGDTPDLYRTSALGMYGGEMEGVEYGDDDDDEMDEDEDAEEEEMDYGEGDSSETEESDDDAEAPVEELDVGMEEAGGDAWAGEADPEVVETDDDEVDDDEDEEEDVDGEEEIMWEGNGEEPPPGDVLDLANEADAGAEGLDEVVEESVSSDEDPANGDHPSEEEFILEWTDIAPGEDDGAWMGSAMWGTVQPPDLPGQRHAHTLQGSRRHRLLPGDDPYTFSVSARRPGQSNEPAMHPLLVEQPDQASPDPVPAAARHAYRRLPTSILPTGGNYIDLVQTISDLVGGEGAQILQQFITHGRGPGAEALQLELGDAGAILGTIERGLHHHHGHHIHTSRSERRPRNSTVDAAHFTYQGTLQRWSEEAKLISSALVHEHLRKLANHVAIALLPAAIEAARVTKERQEKEKAETEKKRAEELKRQEEEKQREEEKRMEEERKRAEEEEARKREEEARAAEQAQQEQADAEENQATAAPSNEDIDMSATSEAPAAEAAEPSTSQPARVTILIRGNPVDITDSGIDVTFLEALPDDMREEIINQHFRERRTTAQAERPPESQISPEFLDALPPDIRAEILQQESMDRARRERAQAAVPVTSGGPSDIDAASFLATLDPSLRQAVLMEQDEGFLQTLPSQMLAEVNANPMATLHRRAAAGLQASSVPQVVSQRRPPPARDAVQLLDKSGIGTLVRLLFTPHAHKRSSIHKVLVNLCENAKTRTELLNMLLTILQSGTADLSAVDKSFSQMSVRGGRTQAPKSTPRKPAPEAAAVSFLNPATENIPNLVAQRCLEALVSLVNANELCPLFFLTEHELPAGLRRNVSKKGKGKEKSAPQTHYPIVLLLGLLDKPTILKTPSLMDFVAGLLASITRPLTTLKDDRPEGSSSTEAPKTSSQDSAPNPSAAGSAPGQEGTEQPAPPAEPEPAVKTPADPSKLLTTAPQIPHSVLRLIVNILATGECSGRTFQQTLSLIQHLSHLPDARDTIASELRSKAQELGQSLYSDLDELLHALEAPSSGDAVPGTVISKFSPASSDQAKLLRILKTIDYMYTSKANGTAQSSTSADKAGVLTEDQEKAQAIYQMFRFTSLWNKLGDCLILVSEKSDADHIATVLLPLIESLMVVCKYVSGAGILQRSLRESMSPRSPTTPRGSTEDLFVAFTDAHRKILNSMVRNNPSLMSGSFSLLVNNPRVLDFDNKRNYFTQKLRRRPVNREQYGALQVNVRRQRVFEDSYQQFQRFNGDQIKYGKLSVRFYDEEGVDAGGVTREWFQILARQMFNPDYALFQPCAADKLTYQPNQSSWVNSEHLLFFKFVGQIIGKAIFDGRLLDAYFARSLYRKMLSKPVDYRDVEWVDPEYYKSLVWILDNDPAILDLTFSVESNAFGLTKLVPLKEGGQSIPVTNENKREFVQLSAEYRLYKSIKDQIEAFLTGFYDIIPKDLIAIFNEQELELLISGTPDIDVDEWRAATDYTGYTSADPVIVWWWRALKSFARDERAKVLSFATGTSKVPLGGFTELQGVQGVQRFSIHKAYGELDRLPQAHTCFNQIDLPQYTSYEKLRTQLLLAINEGGEGFGFA
ncbi:hypothetical protein FRB99_001440 [Tulasnella sp. 403]|nr:hypothetical protein FRB99_001440 [Tulasnella sp. 403]